MSEEDAELAAATSDLPAAPVSPASVTSFKTACLSGLQEYLSSADVEEVRGGRGPCAAWGPGGCCQRGWAWSPLHAVTTVL